MASSDAQARAAFSIASSMLVLQVREGYISKEKALDFIDGLSRKAMKQNPPDVALTQILINVRNGIEATPEPERQ